MSDEELKAARQSGKSGIGILDRLMLEAARLTAERDLLEKAFIATYDELEDYFCEWCHRQNAGFDLPFTSTREMLRAKEMRKEASGE